jgi:hypothetical protein
LTTILLINGVDQDGDGYAEVFPDTPDGRKKARDYFNDKSEVSYSTPDANEVEVRADGTVRYHPVTLI